MIKLLTVSTKTFLLFFFLSFPIFLNAQIDSPLHDNIPAETLRWFLSQNWDNPDAVVITDSEGYDNFNLGVAFAEPHLSQNPNNPKEFFTAFNINTAYRTMDGFTWVTSSPSFGTSVNGDPVTAYDSLGNLYYESMFGGITGCKVIVSTDNGNTWSPAVTSISGADKNWIAADQTAGPYSNYIYTTMTASGFSGHNVARSTNFGATWQPITTFNNSPLPGTMVAVGPNTTGPDIPGGCVYVVTNTGNSFASTYTFYVSTNGGQNFTFKSAQNFAGYVGTNVGGRNSVQNMRTRPYPFIAADNSYGPNRGRLYLVYASNNPAGNGNKPDIFCRYSNDQGVTWSTPTIVNDDLNSQNNHQWHPSIWCDKTTGRLFIKWMDTRDTPTSDSAHIYATYTDDGLTFAPNQRLTTAKMKIDCATCGGGGTPRYQGDYDAITALNNISLSVWTDFRAGSFGSYVGYFPDFAMLASPSSQNVENNLDSTFYSIEVPSVKLYDQDAIFTAVVSPTPAQGNIDIDFPGGNVLTAFPGNVIMRIRTTGSVTVGNYNITITGEGPNGTPVHKRTVQLVVENVIPVELASFKSTVNKNDVTLSWITATEVNNQGFDLQRRLGENEYQTVSFIPGYGTTTEMRSYSYTDQGLNPGVYYYRLLQKDFDGTADYLPEIEVEVVAPIEFALEQNYPNPFNPSTTIKYSVPEKSNVTIKLFDVLGNEVRTLINNEMEAGKYELMMNAGDLSSGVYYYQMNAGGFTQTKKLMLMK